jgi:hypothetical protein
MMRMRIRARVGVRGMVRVRFDNEDTREGSHAQTKTQIDKNTNTYLLAVATSNP